MSISLDVTPGTSGYAKGTKFVFVVSGVSIVSETGYKIRWDFGNGLSYTDSYNITTNQYTIEHIYEYAGNYDVNVSVWATDKLDSETNSEETITQSIIVTEFYSNKILIDGGDDTTPIAIPQTYTVSITSIDVDSPLYVGFYPNNSNSVPFYAIPPKWSFITKKWSLSQNGVESKDEVFLIDTAPCALPTNIAQNTTNVIAVSGKLILNYVDDSPGNVTLQAQISSSNFSSKTDSFIFDYPSFSNSVGSSMVATKELTIQDANITTLKVSENYLNEIYPFKWFDVPIPVMVTINGPSGQKLLKHPKGAAGSTPETVNVVLSIVIDGVEYSSTTVNNDNNKKWFYINETATFKQSEVGYCFTSITIPYTQLLEDKQITIKASITDYSVGNTARTIAGTSQTFELNDLNNSYQIAKVNQNFDYGNYFKQLLKPKHLQQNDALFQFLSAVGGDSNPHNENLGNTIYEKIANFTANHSDPETANIDKLISLANQVDVKAETYAVDFPREVKNLIDLFSIPRHRLRGIKEEYSNVFQLGDLLDENSVVIANQKYYLKDRTSLKYYEIQPNILDRNNPKRHYKASLLNLPGIDTTTLFEKYYLYRAKIIIPVDSATATPVNDLKEGLFYALVPKTYQEGFSYEQPFHVIQAVFNAGVFDVTEYTSTYAGLNSPVTQNYWFYELSNPLDKFYKNNIVDWNSPYTKTVTYNLSSYNDWYGDNKLAEIMFNNVLTKHLFEE